MISQKSKIKMTDFVKFFVVVVVVVVVFAK